MHLDFKLRFFYIIMITRQVMQKNGKNKFSLETSNLSTKQWAKNTTLKWMRELNSIRSSWINCSLSSMTMPKMELTLSL
jgi:hypothetical protein